MYLTNLPAEIGQLSQLQRLSLDNNALSLLPAEIGDLQALRCCNLINNRLLELPETFVQLTELETLLLDCNQLRSWPKQLRECSKLKKLSAVAALKPAEELALPRRSEVAVPAALKKLLPTPSLRDLPASLTHLCLDSIFFLPSLEEQSAELPATSSQSDYYQQLQTLAGAACWPELENLPGLEQRISCLLQARLEPWLCDCLPPATNQREESFIETLTQHLKPRIIEAWTAALFHPQQSYRLNLAQMALRKIPAIIGLFHNLVELDLSHNDLQQLPEELGQLSNLRQLKLEGNNALKVFPDSLLEILHLNWGSLFPEQTKHFFKDLNSWYEEELRRNREQVVKLRRILQQHYMKYSFSNNFWQCQSLYLHQKRQQLQQLQQRQEDRQQLLSDSPDLTSIDHLDGQKNLNYNLKRLNLSASALAVFPEILLLNKHFQYLEELDLSNNELRTLPDNLSSQLPNLRVLKLNGNRLSAFPSSVLGLAKLELLDLRGNTGVPIFTLPSELFSRMPTLWLLANVDDAHLSSTFAVGLQAWQTSCAGDIINSTPEPEQATKQEGLNLAATTITALYVEMVKHGCRDWSLDANVVAFPEQLTRLVLFNCGLAALPPQIGALRRLQELDVTGNCLTTLPKEVGTLHHLRRIYARRYDHSNWKNNLSQLPAAIDYLMHHAIEEVTLLDAPVDSPVYARLLRLNLGAWFREEFFVHKNHQAEAAVDLLVQHSHVARQLLATLTNSDGRYEDGRTGKYDWHTHLRNYWQEQNRLEARNKILRKLAEIAQLSQVVYLQMPDLTHYRYQLPLQERQQYSVVIEAVSDQSSCYSLDLHGLNLHSLPEQQPFSPLVSVLSLFDNKLSQLPQYLAGLECLLQLDVARNRLASFPAAVLAVPSLKWLNIEENLLTILPENLTTQLFKLIYLKVSSNLLDTMHGEIGRSGKLRHLRLDNNRLLTVPPQIKLEIGFNLCLDNNPLIELPASIPKKAAEHYQHLLSPVYRDFAARLATANASSLNTGAKELVEYYNQHIAPQLTHEEAALQMLTMMFAYLENFDGAPPIKMFINSNLQKQQASTAVGARSTGTNLGIGAHANPYARRYGIGTRIANGGCIAYVLRPTTMEGEDVMVEADKAYIIIFRGTKIDAKNLATGVRADLDLKGIGKEDFEEEVTLDNLRKILKEALGNDDKFTYRKGQPGKITCVIAGHSLGGAMALRLFAEIDDAQQRLHNTKLLTFNAPGIDAATVAKINRGISDHIANGDKTPWRNICIFRHADDLVHTIGTHPPGQVAYLDDLSHRLRNIGASHAIGASSLQILQDNLRLFCREGFSNVGMLPFIKTMARAHVLPTLALRQMHHQRPSADFVYYPAGLVKQAEGSPEFRRTLHISACLIVQHSGVSGAALGLLLGVTVGGAIGGVLTGVLVGAAGGATTGYCAKASLR